MIDTVDVQSDVPWKNAHILLQPAWLSSAAVSRAILRWNSSVQLQQPALPLSMADTWSELSPVDAAPQALLAMHQDHDYLAILAPLAFRCERTLNQKECTLLMIPMSMCVAHANCTCST